mmetsp:Transcript_30826/g.46761  ORF Transcript_30826/g.46761 Transcript_30826/m.46761 type:complete len:247 (+) Transcript_30826:58-798(+)|eukprot:CAMPEP_0178922924 /NCGR_PEP_ID=MMETSP0786-20121207/16431_1 /TAXON_ID=186022 /ORGANISM="Thalassionema frauenfeldii, Strain CCMP 1798" /LENGTH=246 /DNA_ID=CAMNT_0020597357 /DNA_START=1 /DNA_END=741 /DNA_ORIENTATION=-
MTAEISAAPTFFPTEQGSINPSNSILYPSYDISDPYYQLTAMDYVWFSFSWILRIIGTFTILICLVRFGVRADVDSPNETPAASDENDSDSEEAAEIRSKVINAIFIENVVDKENFEYDPESNSYQFQGHKGEGNKGVTKGVTKDEGKSDEENNDEENKDVKDEEDREEGSTDDSLSTNTCSICLEKFREGDGVIISACSHVFHRECVLEWLQKKDGCPMCRQSMWDEDEYKKVEEEVIEEMHLTI